MPELPEVETVRRGLEPAMVGARFTKVAQRRPDLRFPFPERFAERLRGRRSRPWAAGPSICWPTCPPARCWSCIWACRAASS